MAAISKTKDLMDVEEGFHDEEQAVADNKPRKKNIFRTNDEKVCENSSVSQMGGGSGHYIRIIMIIFLGWGAAAAFVWIGISSELEKQNDDFRGSAEDAVNKIEGAFDDYVDAASLVHGRCRHRDFTRGDFRELYEYLIATGLSFKAVQFDPNVTRAERPQMEDEARAFYAENYPHVDYQGFRGFNTLNSTTLEPRTEQPFYFPIHYQEPIVGNEAAIDLDYYSSESRIRAVDALFYTKGPSLTDRLSLVKEAGSVSRCGDHDGPSFGLVLMHPGVLLTDPKPTDVVWPRDFSSIVICVPELLLRATKDQPESSLVYIHDLSHPGGKPVFLGGAHVPGTTRAMNGAKTSFLDEVELSELKSDRGTFIYQTNIHSANRIWTITVLSTDDAYQPDHLFVILGGTVITVASLFLAIWIYTSWRRSQKTYQVLRRAERSTAIVTDMFPKNVARQMMEEIDEGDSFHSSSVGTHLMSFDKSERSRSGKRKTHSKPLADLFPDVTIMFADMVGFTAWSSIRDPTSVFKLLETIYSEFDKIADKRGVFKVETVGDCYVAVAGLPEPRSDHAVVMSRFARDCRNRLAHVTASLEVELGPDTSSLGFRFGLHSGPVTAGVLRGQRARFQIFGDAVNTASRIEATGVKGRIQISQTTAELLKKDGKSHWVAPREDPVFAKGIGTIRTFWLNTDLQDRNSLDTSASSASGSERVDDVGSLDQPSEIDRLNKCIDWHTETLAKFVKVIVAQRKVDKGYNKSDEAALLAMEKDISSNEIHPIDEMSGELSFPVVDDIAGLIQQAETEELDDHIQAQLRDFIEIIASKYRANSFHNFEHASHVVMSVVKLLTSMTQSENPSYTLDDPLARFTVVLASVIHDVDHQGVPNVQLLNEQAPVALLYKGKSVAEQNSLDISWRVLMKPEFKDLRRVLYRTETDLRRFREYLVHAVLLTDIVNKDLQTKRKERWNLVFGSGSIPEEEDPTESPCEEEERNIRKTALLELVIQASDVSHTMQHWHIFRQWNGCLFREMRNAYMNGRGGEQDPTDNWYDSEIGFFKFYVIPLAERVKQSRACGALGEELHHYACSNVLEWETKGRALVSELCESLRADVMKLDTETVEGK